MKRLLPIIIAVLLAAFASIGIANWASSLKAEENVASCMVAAKTLKKGQELDISDTTTANVRLPSEEAQGGSVWAYLRGELITKDKAGTLKGRVLNREVKQGTPIMENMFRAISQETARQDWKVGIDVGTRAVSIPVDNIAAVSGLVQVGDHVDVLAGITMPNKDAVDAGSTMIPVQMGDSVTNVAVPNSGGSKGTDLTVYLLQNVEILAVGNQAYNMEQYGEDDVFQALGATPRAAGDSVTVALTPDQVQMVVFAIVFGDGDFILSLRRPGDEKIFEREILPPVSYEAIGKFAGVVQ